MNKRDRYRKLLRDLNGLTISYKDDAGMTWKCIVLAAPKKGLAIKSLASPKHIRRKAGALVNEWVLKPEDPKFCHFHAKSNAVRDDIEFFEGLVKSKKFDEEQFEEEVKYIGGGSSCPFS